MGPLLKWSSESLRTSKKFWGQCHYGKVKGQMKVTLQCCIHTPLNQCPYQISITYTLQFPKYSLDKIFKLKVTMARSKVKSRLNYDVAHLHPQLMSLPSINTLPLIVTEISPRQDICRRPADRPPECRPPEWPPAQPDDMGENNTPKPFQAVG